MPRITWHAIVGILAGIALWWFLPYGTPQPATRVPPGEVLSESQGAMTMLVVHYVPEATFVRETYRQFLRQLPADVKVQVVCPDRAAYDDFVRQVGEVPCRLYPAISHHAMTTWARDRWIALWNREVTKTYLVAPRAEAGSENWPARAGDGLVASVLAREMPGRLQAFGSSLYFDGGDFLADDSHLFVTPAVLRRNLQHTVQSREGLLAELARMTGKRVTLLEDVPDHHATMFMVIAAGNTAVVGDPSLASKAWKEQVLWPARSSREPWQPDFSEQTQKLFDSAAQQAKAAGYRVVRIPVIPGTGSRAYVTYTNGLLEEREGKQIVYLPTYRGLDPINDMAVASWKSLGYEVRSVDCTEVWAHFGTLHCLVGVLGRGRTGGQDR